MPKAKPTQIITHRIELGAWERQNLGKPVAETAQAASMLSSLGVAGFGVAAIGATYAVWKLWGVFEYAKEKVEVGIGVADTVTDMPFVPAPIRVLKHIFTL